MNCASVVCCFRLLKDLSWLQSKKKKKGFAMVAIEEEKECDILRSRKDSRHVWYVILQWKEKGNAPISCLVCHFSIGIELLGEVDYLRKAREVAHEILWYHQPMLLYWTFFNYIFNRYILINCASNSLFFLLLNFIPNKVIPFIFIIILNIPFSFSFLFSYDL